MAHNVSSRFQVGDPPRPDAVPLTPEQAEELDWRFAEHERNPNDVVEWSEAEKRIRESLKR